VLRLFKVRGNSLSPDFCEGDYVLTLSTPFPAGKIKVGDVITFTQPGYGLLIKRVRRILADGHQFDVRGSLIDSMDSRDFGPILPEQVTGKVIWHIKKK
jgi:signal peptidase I